MVTEFSSGLTVPAGPFAICAGPDGNLWFTESTGNRIGRITVTGTVSEFGAGLAGASGICLGPDSNLWFAEANLGGLGVIVP